MKIPVQLVKAFAQDPARGNPAGVVLDAAGLSSEQMQGVARELGYAESAFVLPSDRADFRVRFFAVKEEVDFCGHATIATFHALVNQGAIQLGDAGSVTVKQETKAGIFPVTCYRDGKIMMTQGDPVYGEVEDAREYIAGLLGLAEADLGGLPLQITATAFPILIVPVADLATLRRVRPDLSGITEHSRRTGSNGIYVFTREPLSEGADFAARFFNPRIGNDEDAVTGVAGGALGAYAAHHALKGDRKQFVIEQGFDMGKAGTMYVDVSGHPLVGGYAAGFGETEITA